MADDSVVMAQQSDLLREIRDEMRSMRAGAPVGSASGFGESAQRVQKQAWSDKIAMNQQSSYDWNLGYRHLYQPSMFNDIGGSLGLIRSPASMTQGEFENVSSENLGLRFGAAMTGLLAPGYTHSVNSLAESIYSQSPRFARFGNSSSIFGSGFSRTAAHSLAAQINTMGAGDLRLGTEDYASIARVGMAGGQFDDIKGGTAEFLGQLKQLASATAQLTRQLHTSVEDISKAMSGLRTMGVTDIGQQQRILSGMGAASQVSGISMSELVGASQAVAQAGLGMGVSAEASMLAFGGTAGAIRGLRPSGLITGQRLAAGGGVLGVAGSITQFEQSALSSDMGYLALIGRNQGASGAINQALSGLGTVGGGGLTSGLEYQARRNEILGSATAEDAAYAARSVLQAQVRMGGVSDMRSPQARSMAYSLLRGQGLDDSSAYAYAQLNFTEEGAQLQARTQYQNVAARRAAADKESADLYYTTHTSMGKFRAGSALASSAWSGFLGELGGSSQTGLIRGHLGRDLEAGAAGLLGGRGTAAGLASALARGNDDVYASVSAVDVTDNLDPGSAAGWGTLGFLGAGGGSLAAGAGALALGLSTGGIGLGVLALGAGYAALSGDAFEWTAGAANFVGGGQQKLRGQDARDYMKMQRAASNQVNQTMAANAMNKEKVQKSGALKTLLTMNLSGTGANSSIMALHTMQQAAVDTGESLESIVNIAKASGRDFNLASGSVTEVGGYSTGAFKGLMSDLLGGSADGMPINFGLSENVQAMRRYLGSLDSSGQISNTKDYFQATQDLMSAGATTKGLDAVRENYASKDSTWRGRWNSAAGLAERAGGSRVANRALSSLGDYADLVLNTTRDDRAAGALAEMKGINEGGDMRKLLDAIDNKTTLGTVLIQNNEMFKAMAAVDSADALKKMSARELSAKFGVNERDAADLVKEGHDNNNYEGVRRRLQLMVGDAQGTDSAMAKDVRVASLLAQAAKALERVNDKVNPQAKK